MRIPSLNLDPISEKIESNTHSLHNLVSKIEHLETQISSCLKTACSNVKQLNTYADVTTSFVPLPLVSAPSSSNSYSRVVPNRTLSSEHRECNLILFDLPNHGSLVETKASVDETLEFLVGRSIQIKDLFRLGKYVHPKDFEDSCRPLPVLIKLTTPWDRRLILLQKSNLQKFKIACLFLREDVPPDHKFRLKYVKKDSPSTSEVSHTEPNMSIAALPDDSNVMQSQSTNSNVSNKLPTNKISPPPSSSKDHPLRQSPPPATLAFSQIFTHSRSHSPSPAESNSSASSSFIIVKGTVHIT